MPQIAWHESHYWLFAGWTMFHFLGIGVIIWIFAGALRWTLRRAPPHVRYAVALGSLLTTATVPAALFVVAPHFVGESNTIAVLPTDSVSVPENGQHGSGPPQQFTSVLDDVPPHNRQSSSSDLASQFRPVSWRVFLAHGLETVRRLACRWLPWLWLLGTPLTLIVLACGVTGAGRLRRAGRLLPDGEVVAAGRRLQSALRVGRQVAIFACDKVAAPLLVGIVRPAILLPPAVLAGCSPEQIEMILLHELAHLRRHDNLVNLAQRIIEAALFFHPVIWWLSNWVRLEREECCDRVVVAHTGRPQAYAETLAALALPGIASQLAAAAMADCHLVTRIRHILNLEDETMNVSRKAFVAVAGLLIFAGCFAASFAQTQDATSDAVKKPPVADPAGGPVQLPGGAASDNTAALERAIKAGSIQEVLSQYVIDPIYAGVALDNLAVDVSEVLRNPPSATRLGVEFIVLLDQQAGGQRKWGPEQATGAPDSPDYPNNQGTAWCPATADGQEEWLELTYGEPVEPLVLVVYECLKPGVLTRVVAFDAEGNELNAWSGKDPSPPDRGNGSAISVVPLKLKKIKIVRLRLYFDSAHVEGWNEIDAAGILDVKGTIHWATAATASSTWVDQTAATTTFPVWLGEAERLDYKVHVGDPLRSDVDPVKAGLGGIVDGKASAILLKNILQAYSSQVVDPNAVGWELLIDGQVRSNAAGGGGSDRVTLFEERIKKLEADLAGLREALQQLKSPPVGEKSKTP